MVFGRRIFGPGAVLALVLAWVPLGTARSQPVGTCTLALGEAYLDVGNVRARILNNGNLFYRGEPHVYNVPKGSRSNAIFSGGFWIGGMMDGALRMAATRYGPYEFWAGPLDEAGNPPFDCSRYDRMYKVSKTDVAAYEATGVPTTDLADWPTGLGAPTLDAAGQPIDVMGEPLTARRDRKIDLAAGERPSFLGDQMIWWVMNDMGNTHSSSGGAPIGVEVQALAFAFDRPGVVGNATFYRYSLFKKGVQPLTDAYISLFSDPDLGDFGDDWIGSDSTLGLGYVWNSDNFDGGREGYGTPPALGYDVFQGPLVPSPGSNARAGPDVIPGYRNVPISSVVYYNNGGGVTEDPVWAEDYYNYMRARWKDGKPVSYGGNGRDYSDTPTRFMFSGDAANCAYWTECNATGAHDAISPGDRRFINSSGPFTLEAGGRQDIVWGMVYGRGDDNFDSVTALNEADVQLQAFVDSWFTEWPPPPMDGPPDIAPELLSPADLTDNQPPRLTLWWRCPVGVVGCFVEVATDPNFSGSLLLSSDSLFTPTLEPNTTYWWRGRGFGRQDWPGPWSETRMFRTGSTQPGSGLADFQTIANGAGPLDPPECGAFGFAGAEFPLVACGADRPDGSRQQSSGQMTANQGWGVAVGGGTGPFDNGQSNSYMYRSITGRGRSVSETVGGHYFEWRFTAEGGRAIRWFQDDTVISVPFELWRSPQLTPDDRSDDVRLIPYILDNDDDSIFNLSTPDHPSADGSDDPYTDWIYFVLPEDASAGQAGYDAFFAGDHTGQRELLARQVLVCLNCGSAPPYPQPYPEVGTVFRYVTSIPEPPIPSAPASGPPIRGSNVRFFFEAAVEYEVALEVYADPLLEHRLLAIPSATSGMTVDLPGEGEFYWRVGSDVVGWSPLWLANVVSATGVEADGLPTDFALEPAYPNPFNPLTTIRYAVPAASPIRVEVFDMLGRRVASLVDVSSAAPGIHETRFDASRLASGVYLVTMRAGTVLRTRTVVLAK